MTAGADTPGAAGRKGIAVARTLGVLVLALVVSTGLATHPGFEPVYLVRALAPLLALVLGGAFTHALSRDRQRVDVPGEFNPSSRALFLGLVMLVVTLLSWFAVAQALPAFWTAAFGTHRSEMGTVARQVPLAPGPDCRYRLEIGSPSVPRPMDLCVAEPLWNRATAGGSVAVELLGSAFGAEIVDVRP